MLCNLFIQKYMNAYSQYCASDFLLSVRNMCLFPPRTMMNSASSDDMRISEIKGKITTVEGDLEVLYGFVDRLPQHYQTSARAALRRAVSVGRTMEGLHRLPADPPVLEDGSILLGPELRRHILETRKVYSAVEDLQQTITDIFDAKSQEQLRSILRNERDSNSATASTEFDIAA
jgi:hypothetical protein